MPRRLIDFAPKLPTTEADEPTEHKPIVSFHGKQRVHVGWPAVIISIGIILAAAGYIWFV